MNININNQDIHYNKYIKYKTKYLELKELNGGVGSISKWFSGLFRKNETKIRENETKIATEVATQAAVQAAKQPEGPEKSFIEIALESKLIFKIDEGEKFIQGKFINMNSFINANLIDNLRDYYKIYLKELQFANYDKTLSIKNIKEQARDSDLEEKYYDSYNYCGTFYNLRKLFMEASDIISSIMVDNSTKPINTRLFISQEKILSINKIITNIILLIDDIKPKLIEQQKQLQVRYPKINGKDNRMWLDNKMILLANNLQQMLKNYLIYIALA